MECSLLWELSFSVNLIPQSSVSIKNEQIIETLLACVNTSEDNDLIFIIDCTKSVPGSRSDTFNSTYFEPQF